MKTKLMVCVFAIAMALVWLPNAYSNSIIVGDQIRFFDREGSTNGGEFGVAELPNVNTELFRTFCVQKSEYLDFSPAGFNVVGITKTVQLSGIPLSEYAAFLYYKFATGTLFNYDYTANSAEHVHDANVLQNLIWYYQGQSYDGSDPEFTEWKMYAESQTRTQYLNSVSVLNLTWAHDSGSHKIGEAAQDVLILVPEPMTLLLLGLGLFGLGITRKIKK
jgi:hypothetical protein